MEMDILSRIVVKVSKKIGIETDEIYLIAQGVMNSAKNVYSLTRLVLNQENAKKFVESVIADIVECIADISKLPFEIKGLTKEIYEELLEEVM